MSIITLVIAAIASTTMPSADSDRVVTRIPVDNAALASEAGRRQVRRHIAWAVDSVCGPMHRAGSVIVSPEFRACREAALADANRQLDAAVAALDATRVLAAR